MILTPGSDRQTAARRFGLEVRRALAARGKTIRGFSAEAGIGRTRLQNWIAGASLPPVATADRLADLLMWPRLAELARAGRRRTCDDCGREFTVETASPQRYCSTECQRVHNKVAGSSRDLSRAVMERRVRRLVGAVEAMCRSCEPSGVCRTSGCPLQEAGVSSHRLAASA